MGEHVPYPIESGPSGVGAQLAGESALYCRVITEGMFGIRPTGLKSFDLTPRLPQKWNAMLIRNVKGFGDTFDILVTRVHNGLEVQIKNDSKSFCKKIINEGAVLSINLN